MNTRRANGAVFFLLLATAVAVGSAGSEGPASTTPWSPASFGPGPLPRADAAPAAQAARLVSPDVAEYLALVSAYRKGPPERAVAAIRAWDDDRLERTVRDIPTQVSAYLGLCQDRPEMVTFTALDAAVLLHTDAAAAALNESDGREASLHLDQAQKILEWASRRRPDVEPPGATGGTSPCDAPPPVTLRDWYLVSTRLTLRAWALTPAGELARRLARVAPDDPDALSAAGNVMEGLATNDAQYFLPPPAWRLTGSDWRRAQERYQQSLRQRRAYRDEAGRLYARALTIAPDRQDIRLRLGWVLLQLGREGDAREALELVRGEPGTRSNQYLALLFLGRVHENSDRLAEAVTSYRRAAEIDPEAHVARLALSHALGRRDLLDDSLAEVLRALAPPGLSAGNDPWTEYPFGDWRAGIELLDRLRDLVRERPGGGR